MAAYIIATLNIHDRDRYADYEAGFLAAFEPYGGRFHCVDEAPETLEGEWDWTRTVIIEFKDKETARAWYESADYQAIVPHRQAASVGHVALLNGMPEA